MNSILKEGVARRLTFSLVLLCALGGCAVYGPPPSAVPYGTDANGQPVYTTPYYYPYSYPYPAYYPYYYDPLYIGGGPFFFGYGYYGGGFRGGRGGGRGGGHGGGGHGGGGRGGGGHR